MKEKVKCQTYSKILTFWTARVNEMSNGKQACQAINEEDGAANIVQQRYIYLLSTCTTGVFPNTHLGQLCQTIPHRADMCLEHVVCLDYYLTI